MDYEFWRNLRLKENKTKEEQLLLDSRSVIANISEYLISYDKCHSNAENTLEKIREEISQISNEL